MNSQDLAKIAAIDQEMGEIISLFSKKAMRRKQFPQTTVTTRQGRTYTVANIYKMNVEWEITNFISKGIFLCSHCKPSQFHLGDWWFRFTHHRHSVKIHYSLMHCIDKHPAEISAKKMDKLTKVFLKKGSFIQIPKNM